ncbi:MAG TPA: class I SAM-dependent methyltransferase [Thermoanaerobaculia bacterium]|nr:class I SAM-dependent methyltransferase [Thermoanaerobaculia bacterium]
MKNPELDNLFSGRSPQELVTAAAAEQRRSLIREFYDRVNDSLTGSSYGRDAIFLNFGYLADEHPRSSAVRLPAHWVNRNRMDLVLELVGDCELAGCSVLDVGCGRGGTLTILDRFFHAGKAWGLDLSPAAVAFCRRHLGKPNLRFVNGDAERLPFRAGSFDVVTNVESSCLYPDIYAFYREVHRVLSPRGRFLYTDVMPVAHLDTYLTYLRDLGFSLARDQDITDNVLLSLEFDAGNQPAVQGQLGEMMDFFLATPGSQPYSDLRAGRLRYHVWQLEKSS